MNEPPLIVNIWISDYKMAPGLFDSEFSYSRIHLAPTCAVPHRKSKLMGELSSPTIVTIQKPMRVLQELILLYELGIKSDNPQQKHSENDS